MHAGEAPDRREPLPLSLAAAPATALQQRIALLCSLLLSVLLLACAVLARAHIVTPELNSALVVGQSMTAYLLGSQMVQQRALSLILPAVAFMYSVTMYNIAPRIFALVAGPPADAGTEFAWVATFAWIGFAVCFIAFAMLRRALNARSPRRRHLMVLGFTSPVAIIALGVVSMIAVRGLENTAVTSHTIFLVALVQAAMMTAATLAFYFSTRATTVTQLWLTVGLLSATYNAYLLIGAPAGNTLALGAATVFGLISCIAIPVVYIIEFNWLYARLAILANALQIESRVDALTRVANRRLFDETFAAELSFAARNSFELSLLIIDIDNFKALNDARGHQAGDMCLREVAALLDSSVVRGRDMVARYGGEEFVVILPRVEAAGAMHVAEKLRARIENLGLEHGRSAVSSNITISVGATAVPAGFATDADSVVRRADAALYRAKAAGKNRCIFMPLRDIERANAV